jgi:hypothetical protein
VFSENNFENVSKRWGFTITDGNDEIKNPDFLLPGPAPIFHLLHACPFYLAPLKEKMDSNKNHDLPKLDYLLCMVYVSSHQNYSLDNI